MLLLAYHFSSFHPKLNSVSTSFYRCRLLAAIGIGLQSGAKVNVLCAWDARSCEV